MKNRRPIRVLSVFDGISSGKVALDKVGLDIEMYFASEIDREAMLVSDIRHPNKILQLGDVTEINEEKVSLLLSH